MSNSTSTPNTGLSYKDAGVDIEAGDALVDRIKSVAKRTARPEVMGGLGGFGALCKIPKGYEEPVLVSGTDGVGTKLRLALNLNRHDTIGQDLVAMCVNDLLVCGAEPLFFLDYYATGHLNVDVAANVVTGIGKGCELAGCALVVRFNSSLGPSKIIFVNGISKILSASLNKFLTKSNLSKNSFPIPTNCDP